MEAVNKWHKTRTGYLVFALVELALAYGFASWAIDSGRIIAYVLSVLFFVGGLRNLFKVFKNGHRKK
jgi:hypothetical protein